MASPRNALLAVLLAMALVCAMGARQLQEPEFHVAVANNPTPTALLSVSSFSRKLLQPEDPKEPAEPSAADTWSRAIERLKVEEEEEEDGDRK